MAASAREVVRAHDDVTRIDLPRAADVVGGREGVDFAELVVGGEPGEAPDLAEGAVVEQ